MGRPMKPFRTVQWCFRIPEHLAARFDLILAKDTAKPIMPNARQDIFIPILERLWAALQSDASEIYVGDVLANLRSQWLPPSSEEPPQ